MKKRKLGFTRNLLLFVVYLHEMYIFLTTRGRAFVDRVCPPGLPACSHWLVMFTN